MEPAQDLSFEDLDAATRGVRDLIGAAREVTGRIAHAMGMNPNDMTAIGALIQNGPMGVAELAIQLGIRSPSATALVDRLERAGHVERIRDSVDRRRVIVTETAAARLANYRAWFPMIDAVDEICRELPDRDRSIVEHFLNRVTLEIRQFESVDERDSRSPSEDS